VDGVFGGSPAARMECLTHYTCCHGLHGTGAAQWAFKVCMSWYVGFPKVSAGTLHRFSLI
jgi:hypothetical protein